MVIPAGSVISAPSMPIHNDASNLLDPDVFDGFRYSRMNKERSGQTNPQQMTDTEVDYALFGYGRHAWYEYISPSSHNIGESLLTHAHL